jgi:hypothetical protein
MTRHFFALRATLLLLGALICPCFFSVQSPAAAAGAPGWSIVPLAAPTNFDETKNVLCPEEVGGFHPRCDQYNFTVTNSGTAPTDGSPITLAASIPAGLTVQSVALLATGFIPAFHSSPESPPEESFCTISPVRCVYHEETIKEQEFPAALAPQKRLTMRVLVTVNPGTPAGSLTASLSVEGGGAAAKTATISNTVNGSTPAFGFDGFSFAMDGNDGQPDRQAGDHPNEVRTVITLNNEFQAIQSEGEDQPWTTAVEPPKDIVVDLPVGLVGSVLAAPQCPLAQESGRGCPPDTVVGEIVTRPGTGASSVRSKIWNLVPERGYPAEFGYRDLIHGAHVLYSQVVPTPAGYVLQTTSPDIPTISLAQIETVFYGDPVTRQAEIAQEEGLQPAALPHVPFLTNPTSCSGVPLTATVYMDSWEHPGAFNSDGTPNLAAGNWVESESQVPPSTDCDQLRFESQLLAQPTTHEADKPSGLDFELNVPQSETVGVPGTSTLKKTVARFPEGFTVDPSAGDGLAACSEAEIGWSEAAPGPMKFNGALPSCPEASKIGTLELETPLVPHKLEGELFLAAQDENPFHSTLATYIVVNDPITGVLIKIAGKLEADPHTGRLTATFPENPSLPFSDLKLHFFGGPRAELATPESCGAFITTTEMEPWSAPSSGPPASPFDTFLIDENCPSGFNPSFTAGSTNLQAGAFTPFVTSFSRSDTDQELSGLTVTLPPGLLGKIAGIPLCGEAEASAGTCPEGSLVGTVKAGAGPGPNPLFVSGKAYLTGPYNGGPYGLAVVVPAVAGPFNFGTVVVRQSLRIDPRTAQVTDVSDPFPKIIDGIPLRMRRIDVELNRPGFTFNPTSCGHLGFSGAISGSPLGAPTELRGTVGYSTEAGSSASVAAPFQVTNCQTLQFTPAFKASVTGKTSKRNGAGLSVKLTYPKGAMGTQANVARVKVELPRQLPSRLSTLQQACLAATFEANPASCPAHSLVGHARVVTPVLPDALEGPAYFVSHGAEAFPSLTILLQGDNVTVELVGSTFISKAGITSTTFKTTPDVPFERFELTLPQGQFSALGTNANLCRVKSLKMPTEFTAQNGMTLDQTTLIGVTGCPTHVAVVKHKRKGNALVLSVYAPGAGRIRTTGTGTRTTSSTAKGREAITVAVPITDGGRLGAKLKVTFVSSSGAHQALRLRI